MKKLFALAMALCLLLTAIPALALDQHEPTFYEDQMKLLVDNLQTWYEENTAKAIWSSPLTRPSRFTS